MGIKYRLNPETMKLEEIAEAPRPRPQQFIITDDIPEGIQSMVTKNWHTSKSSLRREYKEHGFIEKGNDEVSEHPDPRDEERHDEEIERCTTEAYYAVRDGMAPLSEIDKHRCQLTNRNLDRYNYDRRERDELGNVIE